MKTRFLSILATCALTSAAAAQSTAFTYQGQLRNAGQPANGLHDMRFRLLDAANGGAQVGATLCADNVSVADGIFQVQLDFGQQFATPTARHLEVSVRPDIGQPCTDLFAYVVLSPLQQFTATPLSLHSNAAFSLDAPDGSPSSAVFVDSDGRVGVGTTSPGLGAPSIKLDVEGGSIRAGNAGDQADLLWLASERSWVFRQEGTGAGAALKLQSIGGGGNKHFIVQTDGFVGIGTTSPSAKLHVSGDIIGSHIQGSSLSCSGATINGVAVISGSNFNNGLLQVTNSISSGTAVLGISGTSSLQSNLKGVHGRTSSAEPNSFGVFATGRLSATGTKSFRIDHPQDPENQYLFHYCAESPEVINFYRGTATLDAQGRAVVTLPSYFALINTKPSYQLTAVGAPMPLLHVSVRISDQALHAGSLHTGRQAPQCWFAIDGGVPGGEVSWRVDAARNDAFVRTNGAPVEVQKPDYERGVTEFAQPRGPR